MRGLLFGVSFGYFLAVCSFLLLEFHGVDSFDFGDEVEMIVRGNNLFDSVVNHGGGVDGIAGGDILVPF